MNLSVPMKVILGVVAVLVVLRIITPTPEQEMLNQMNQEAQDITEYYTQQNQAMQIQSMQMLNQMNQMPQNYVDPYQGAPNMQQMNPGYYQQNMSQQPGYTHPSQASHSQGNADWNW